MVYIREHTKLMSALQQMLLGGGGVPTLSLIVSSNTEDLNLHTLAEANGWDGVSLVHLVVTINSGVTVSASATTSPALWTGSAFPIGSTIRLNNAGSILGKGGAGGTGSGSIAAPGNPGGNGGTAVEANQAITIDNTGTINAGDGGNGGAGANALASPNTNSYCSATESIQPLYWSCGTLSAGANGGNGGSSGANGSTGATGANGSTNAGCPPSLRTCSGSAGGAGGARGAYIYGNAYVSWVNTGTRNGAVA